MPPSPGSPSLAPWRFDPHVCRADLAAFELLLAAKAELGEREDVLPFFRAHPHLAALLGTFHPNLHTFDRLGLEVPLFGMFQADAIVGDWEGHAFCLVEFEDARPNSVFARRGRQTSEWAACIERGFSQIVDWLWLLDDQRQTAAFEALFGARHPDVYTLLVVGRERGLSAAERQRLDWRRSRVLVNSQHIYCCTFDELAATLSKRLRAFASPMRNAP